MKEIKFRIWIEPDKVMNYIFGMRSDGIVSLTSNKKGFSTTLMQYTGIKDMNGVEIWEGDKLCIWMQEDKQNTPYIVKDMRQFYYESYYRISKCKVIGNIYEKD